jgi:uncharacterized repeat protein (TIGR03809 family)
MTQRPGIAFSHGFAARGRALAERRLAYLSDLYETGRWARFYTQAKFISTVREARAAVEAWQHIEQFDPSSVCWTDPAIPAEAATLGTRGTLGHVFVPSAEPLSEVGLASEDSSDAMITPLKNLRGQDIPLVPEQPSRPAAGPSRLPPVAFSMNITSAESIGAERDLSEA